MLCFNKKVGWEKSTERYTNGVLSYFAFLAAFEVINCWKNLWLKGISVFPFRQQPWEVNWNYKIMVYLKSTEPIQSLWITQNQISEGINVTETQFSLHSHSHSHSPLVLVFCCTFSSRRPQKISNPGNKILLWRHWIEWTDFIVNNQLQGLSIYIQYMWAGSA